MRVMPALLYTFAIFYGGLVRPRGGGPMLPHADKLMHALAFGLMQLVVFRALRFELPRLGVRRQNVLALGLVVAAGGALEIAQSFTGYRSAELLDLLADAAGAGLVAALLARTAGRDACAGSAEPES
jgi:VanZ family protein